MNKIITAMTVSSLIYTGCAGAAVIYDQDDNKVELKGSLRLMLDGSTARAREDGTSQYKLDDESSRIGFRFERKIDEKLKALVYYEWGNDTQATESKDDTNLTNRQAYGGIHYDGIGEFDFGRVTVPFESVHQSDYTYEFGNNGALYYGGEKTKRVAGSDNNYIKRISNTLKYTSDKYNGFWFGASYTLQDESEINDIEYAWSTAVYYDTPVNLHLRAGLAQQKSNGSTDSNADTGYFNIPSAKEQTWGISAKYDIPVWGLSFAVDYGGESIEDGNSGESEGYTPYGAKTHAKLFGVGTKWSFNDKQSAYATWAIRDGDEAADNYQETRTVVGTDYKFNKTFILWLEYSTQNNRSNIESDTQTDDKSALGLRYYF
ncbi:porin [Lelliottia sp. V106_10]|uniref:porin n=1 Tax=Lelliottia wanjuensis TaxID=3050585 RepID=UPI00254A9426|nr:MULTISPECIES: porin [unclassified Lelliottia]MDK9358909.1 porin [Lelliottia sp. V106_16]MDK9373597.1 porin [Lelliottia sp. V106_10]MDK9600363.1 porin [Lelliottia sp. V106_5]